MWWVLSKGVKSSSSDNTRATGGDVVVASTIGMKVSSNYFLSVPLSGL